MSTKKNLKSFSLPIERIQGKILLVRGTKVLLDSDLAEFYEVPTHRLNEAVTRNLERFPDDFMFRLNDEEFNALSTGTGHGGRRKNPRVFTESGVSMLSAVLKSNLAIQVSIQIIRAFTQLRKILSTNEELRQKIQDQDKKFDYIFRVLKSMNELLDSPSIRLPDSDKKMGFEQHD